jgi:hypothetical protein
MPWNKYWVAEAVGVSVGRLFLGSCPTRVRSWPSCLRRFRGDLFLGPAVLVGVLRLTWAVVPLEILLLLALVLCLLLLLTLL